MIVLLSNGLFGRGASGVFKPLVSGSFAPFRALAARNARRLADGCLDNLTRQKFRELADEWEAKARLVDPPASVPIPESTIHAAGDKRVDVSGRKIDPA